MKKYLSTPLKIGRKLRSRFLTGSTPLSFWPRSRNLYRFLIKSGMTRIKCGMTRIIIVSCWSVAIASLLSVKPVFAANSGPFTAEVWVNPTTSNASKAILGKAEELRIFTDASGYVGCQIKASTWQTAAQATTTALSLNTWAHVSCAYDKANIKVYVNGVQVATTAQTSAPDDTSAVFRLGQDDSASTPYANLAGVVDDFN